MTCRICNNAENNSIYHPREMMLGLREAFTYFQCSNCQCLQIESIPADLSKYYPANYNGFAAPRTNVFEGLGGVLRKQRYKAALFSESFLAQVVYRLFPAKQYRLFKKLPVHFDSKILDVGSGQGAYLYPLYELGMKHVQGVDPFISAPIVYPNGYKVAKSFIDQVKGKWDVILYNHSFEHAPNPLANLQAVEQLLEQNGTCIIRTPTVSSYAWEHYRTDWFQLDPPRHLFLHSIKSMSLLAQKANLKLVDVIYDSTSAQFIHSEKYKQDIAMYENASTMYTSLLDRKIKKLSYERQAQKLNQEHNGDQAAFFLKK